MISEVSAQSAADILGASRKTIWQRVKEGKLPARRQGERGVIRISLDDLREFARQNGYRFNADLARTLTE